jgi:hypothetical protein
MTSRSEISDFEYDSEGIIMSINKRIPFDYPKEFPGGPLNYLKYGDYNVDYLIATMIFLNSIYEFVESWVDQGILREEDAYDEMDNAIRCLEVLVDKDIYII